MGEIVHFDPEKARQNRERAIAQAGLGKAHWMAAAKWAVVEVALELQEFTTDAVWAKGLEKPDWGSARAMGPVMRAAAQKGIIEPTDRFIPTDKADSHRQPIRVWRSKIKVK